MSGDSFSHWLPSLTLAFMPILANVVLLSKPMFGLPIIHLIMSFEISYHAKTNYHSDHPGLPKVKIQDRPK